MLKETARPREEYEAFSKAKNAIVQVLNGESGYDDLDLPLDEEDREEHLAAVRDGNLHRDLGPPQEETVPLEDDFNPFPGLERPVEF